MDYITGLAPRAELHARLESLAAGAAACALVICDIVGLKGVNEHGGFLAGDAVLRAAADRLRAAAPDADLVARLGGDELVALFSGPAAAAAARGVANVLAAPGTPPLRAVAVQAEPGEFPGPFIARAYATMRRC